MEGREAPHPAIDLPARLRRIARECDSRAKAAAEGLPAGFGQVDDVIVLLQPLRSGAPKDDQASLESTLRQLAEKNFLTGTQAIEDNGVWAGLLSGCAARGFGFHVELSESEAASAAEALLAERHGRALVSARPKAHMPLANFVERGGRFIAEAIGRVTARDVRVRWMGETVLEAESLDLETE